MTVTTTTNYKEYQADGIATVYAIPFLLLDRSDLLVYLNNQLITTGYTISRIGEPISQITFAEAPNGLLLLQRRVELLRDTDYQENGDLLASTLNKDFDRLYLIMQGFKQNESQSLRVEDAEGVNQLPIKSYRANKLLGFDADGQPSLITTNSGSALELAQNLADASNENKGAGIIGFGLSTNYPKNSAGYAINLNIKSISVLDKSYLALADKVDKLEKNPTAVFTIIYPNGGTEENPADISVNNRYVLDNPFPNKQVICQAEILFNDSWGNPEWVWTNSSYGVRANLFNDQIIVQTGLAGINNLSANSGNPFNTTTALTSAPCRVLVWRVG